MSLESILGALSNYWDMSPIQWIKIRKIKNEMEENRKFPYQCTAVSRCVFPTEASVFVSRVGVRALETAHACVHRAGHEVEGAFHCFTSK